MSDTSDAELVRLCLSGDARAHARLLDRHKGRVYSFLLRLVGDAADAEDLAQETFIKAFRALEAFDQKRVFRSWLFAIAHHAALDFLRARKPASLSLDHDEDPIDPPDADAGPESRAEAAIQSELVERLIASLPPLYREVLLLRHIEDMSVEAVAATLGLPEGTVKIRLFRARELMRRKWEAFEKDETRGVPDP